MADHSQDTQHGHQAHGTDTGAAYIGLVIGALFLLAVVLTIVTLTNKHYASEKADAPAAAAPR